MAVKEARFCMAEVRYCMAEAHGGRGFPPRLCVPEIIIAPPPSTHTKI